MEGGDRIHIVDLAQRSCTCGRWQEVENPCGHTLVAVKRLPERGSTLGPFLPASFATATWAAAYATALALVNRQPRRFLVAGLEKKDSARRTLAVLSDEETGSN